MSWFLFIVVFSGYLVSQYPGLSPYRDSGDLASSAFALGIAHPPGYPLYTLLGKCFLSLVPFGNPAYRLNAASGLLAAASASLLCRAVFSMTGNRLAGFFTGLLFALTPSLLSLGRVSEMYSLNAFLACGILLCARAGRPFYLLGFFIFGIALANHQTILLWLPGYLLLTGFSVKRILHIAFLLLLGLSLYLYLPVRSLQEPDLNWGRPSTVRNFARMLTRADYGSIRLHPEKGPESQTLKGILQHLRDFLRATSAEVGVIPLACALAGFFFLRPTGLFGFCLFGFLLSGPAFFILANLPMAEASSKAILEPYLILPAILLCFCCGLAFAVSLRWRFWVLLPILALVGSALFDLGKSFRRDSCRENFGEAILTRDILRTASPDALFFNPDDTTAFGLRYIQTLGRRRDIRLLAFYKTRWGYDEIRRLSPEVLPNRKIDSARDLENTLAQFNLNSGRLLLVDNLRKTPSWLQGFPRGLLYEISQTVREDGRFPPRWFEFYTPPVISDRENFFEKRVVSYYASGWANLGLSLLRGKKFSRAEIALHRALALDSADSQIFNNIGVLYYETRRYSQAAEAYREGLKISPRDISLRHNLGLALTQIGNVREAISEYQTALEMEERPGVLNDLGLLYWGQKNYPQARAAFLRAVEKLPNYSFAFYNLALVEEALGNRAASASAYKRYLELEPAASDRQEVLSRIRRLETSR